MKAKSIDRGITRCALFTGLVAMLVFLLSSANAQTKRAMVIGNADYQSYGYQQNLLFDVDAVAASLRAAGFEVDRVTDADLNALHSHIDAFATELDTMGDDGVGLFVFSGLVLQGFGTSYIMPVGAGSAGDFKFDQSAIDIDQAIRKMSGNQSGHRIFVIDARRNDILTREFGVAQGISAEMEPPLGSFIAFSNGPQGSAGGAAASPSAFAQTLAAQITRPYTSVEALFETIEQQVEAGVGAAQTVWSGSGLLETVSLASPARPAQLKTSNVLASADILSSRNVSTNSLIAPKDIIGPVPSNEEALLVERDDIADKIEVLVAKSSNSASGQDDEFIRSILPVEQSFDQMITFSTKLINGSDHVKGRSIEQLIKGSPLYPPIAELPKELWEDQTCSNCHQWDQANLCVQAGTYLRPTGESSVSKRHPYGGSLKANLQIWARDGCR